MTTDNSYKLTIIYFLLDFHPYALCIPYFSMKAIHYESFY